MDVLQKLEHFLFNECPAESLDKETLVFREALMLLVDGKSEEAEAHFHSLYKTSEDKTLRDICANFLFDSYFSQGMWSEMEDLELLEYEAIDKDNRLIASICRRFKEKYYLFNESHVTLPLTLSASGCPMAKVLINGVSQQFWLDTGAGMTVISSRVAEACGILLKERGITIEASTNERIGANLACIEQIALGGVTIRNQPALLLPNDQLTIQDPKTNDVIIIDGIIGWDILKDLSLELNYANRQVTINQPTKNEERSVGNLFFSGYPIVKVYSSDMEPLYFGYDTGAQYTHFGQSLLSKLPNLNVHRKTIHAGGVGGYKEVEVEVADALSLFLGDQFVNVRNSRKVLLEYATFFKLDGVFGSDCCQNGKLMIDYPNRRLELITS